MRFGVWGYGGVESGGKLKGLLAQYADGLLPSISDDAQQLDTSLMTRVGQGSPDYLRAYPFAFPQNELHAKYQSQTQK